MIGDYLPLIISSIMVILLCAATILGVNKIITEHDDKLWNDGHCKVCGGSWEYEQAVGHRASTSYIYICDKCGKRIEINEVR